MLFSSQFAVRPPRFAWRGRGSSKFAKKFILHTSYFILFVLILSGCRAIGSTNPAALQITSTPEASVFIDNKHVGKTPYTTDQLRAREYQIKLTSSEATYVEKINLIENTLTVINRDLNNNFLAQSGEVLYLEPGKRGIIVVSMPQEADLTLDGKYIGKTPTFIEEIEEGDHKILLAKAGFIEREFAVQTSKDYRLNANVTLASEIAKGIGPSPAPAPQIEKVEILKTPQGFLRVRKEPQTTSGEVGRVKTGDQLEVIQEIKDWYKISFEGKQGWISSQFAKKI